MIQIQSKLPRNRAHFSRLLEFCREVVVICQDLDIEPVLNGSLAVFAYTKNEGMRVNDIDLACSEFAFPRLSRTLDAKGIVCVVKEWHVLQARRDDLKVEFDSIEYWMAGLAQDYDTLVIEGCALKVVSLSSLKELYKRGLEATASQSDRGNRTKHLAIAAKYAALCSL
jgi:hypothetical protein